MHAVVAGERPLTDVVARLDERDPWTSYVVGTPQGDGWYGLDRVVADEALAAAWLADLQDRVTGGHRDVAGSYLASWLGSLLVGPLAATVAGERRAWRLTPGDLAVHRHEGGWFDALALAPGPLTVVAGDPPAGTGARIGRDVEVLPDEAALHRRVADDVVGLLGPVLGHIRANAPFGWGGLWGTVADAIADAAVTAATSAADALADSSSTVATAATSGSAAEVDVAALAGSGRIVGGDARAASAVAVTVATTGSAATATGATVADKGGGAGARDRRTGGAGVAGPWGAGSALIDALAERVPALRARATLVAVAWSGGVAHRTVRGTCCLYHKISGCEPGPTGEAYCVNCPKRDAADRVRRWVAELEDGAAAREPLAAT